MRNLIIAIALSLVSSASFANGFSPWDQRQVVGDQSQESSINLSVIRTGFAPWAEFENKTSFENEQGIAIEITEQNIFRPWS